MTRRVAAGVATLLLSAVACGPAEMSDASALELQEDVASVREAADAGESDAAFEALAELRTTVKQARADGELSDERAREILKEADDVAAELRHLPDAATREEDLEGLDDEGGDGGEDEGDEDALETEASEDT